MTLSKEIDTFNVIRFTEEWTVYWDPRVKGSKGLWIVFIMDLFEERERSREVFFCLEGIGEIYSRGRGEEK